ncbi:polyketide synthase [Whalleya microplaca]|nr:polyketide synthase [Whalleya microplaca]
MIFKMDEPIAIIGLDARFPGDGDTAEDFYNLLLDGRSARTEIPPDRYNAEAFWHPDAGRCGTTKVRSGHFLTGSISAFDAPFFSITPTEASSMDPQQRGMLETVYRALENAGIPLTSAAGTQTGVYVGCFSKDYSGMIEKDLDVPLMYAATGTVVSMLSSRVSWFFDFKGPSITIDTACSSSLVAVHQACMSLKLREVSMAVVGGCNLILSPELSLELDKAGVLSPDGSSKSFDHRANGYSRGEGFGVVVLKRISDAIRDGDVIRAVIRNSGSNQDGRSPGITQPTKEAQAHLIREVYSRAGLDPSLTRFFEAHGTGTLVGDPIEASAIADVFASHRSSDQPMYVGALKSNVGHLEGAAGIAAIIKGVYTLEHGIIPSNTWFEKPNPKIMDSWNLRFPTKAIVWPQSGIRRMSANSFGIGGANAHVVMDDALHFLKQYHRIGNHRTLARPLIMHHPYMNGSVDDIHSSTETLNVPGSPSFVDEGVAFLSDIDTVQEPQLYVLSSYDQEGISRQQDRYRKYLNRTTRNPLIHEEQFLKDLSYTLAYKRTHHGWRSFSISSSQATLQKALEEKPTPTRAVLEPRVAFVFTGQGAQWPAMGRELMAYPAFQRSVYAADEYLNTLGCSWSLTYELCKDSTTSRIGDAEFCQPLCTALQIALVDLLATWNVHPDALIGHSSGEIAAAYAAGHISREAAWRISYYRGKLSARLSRSDEYPKTGMAAIALDRDKTLASIKRINSTLGDGTLEIACMNSQESHTVSGSLSKIDAIVNLLTDEKVFARKLNVENAYHSQYMKPISEEYLTSIGDIEIGSTSYSHGAKFFSSTYGTAISPSRLRDPTYWITNLISPVRFYEATMECLRGVAEQTATNGFKPDLYLPKPITDILEIGPHSALKGPLRSITTQVYGGDKIKYHSLLRRRESAVETSLEAVGSLWCRGISINLLSVNKTEGPGDSSALMLTDLPSYSFNHSTEYWYESRLSRASRFPRAVRHELLGKPVPDWNKDNAIWRNWIRMSENPWIEDHKVLGDIIYPAGAMLAMAVEASRQISDTQRIIKGFRFKDVSFHSALRIPADTNQIESRFYLRRCPGLTPTRASILREFQFLTIENDDWTEHCRGFVQIEYETEPVLVQDSPDSQTFQEKAADESKDTQDIYAKHISHKDVYNVLRRSGYDFGPLFRTLAEVWLSPTPTSVAKVQSTVPVLREQMPHKYIQPHLLHPVTLDGAFQASLAPLILDSKRASGKTLVPYYAKEIWISSKPLATDETFTVISRSQWRGLQKADTSFTALSSESQQAMICATGFTFKSIPGKDLDVSHSKLRPLAFNIDWKPDIAFLGPCQPVQGPVLKQLSPYSLVEYRDLCLVYIRRVLNTDLVDRIDVTRNHYHKYVSWMKHIVEESSCDSSIEGFTDDHVRELEQRIEANDRPEGKLIVAIGRDLPRILSGRIDPLEVFFSGKLAAEFYRSGYGAERCYSQLCNYVDVLAHKNPAMDILEIGAGTGGATRSIIETLSCKGPRYRHYDFTDISPAFFEEAHELFKHHLGRMSFQTLNVEKSPTEQGFEAAKYDIIIAANVLHATKNIDTTLSNVRSLLKPGGKLLLYEVTNATDVSVTLIFGVLPGWWLSEDPERVWGPLMAAEDWNRHLVSTGFTGLDAKISDSPDPANQISSVLISTASKRDSEPREIGPVCIVIQESSHLQRDIANHMSSLIASRNPCEIADITTLLDKDLGTYTCVVLAELESSILRNMTNEMFGSLQHIVRHCKTLLWVTGSGLANPDQELVIGLARVIRAEIPALRFITISFEQDECPDTIVDKSMHILANAYDNTDNAFAVIGGVISISRVVEANHLDNFVQGQISDLPVVEAEWGLSSERPLALQVGAVAQLDKLRFEDDLAYSTPLGEYDVEFKVMACGVSSRDLALVLGHIDDEPILGLEASGVVTRVGPKAKFQVGDRVFGLSISGTMKSNSRSQEPLLAVMPDTMSWIEAASIPFAYSTAYAVLLEMGSIQKEDTILIHSAVCDHGQAAIQLAQYHGAEVFATVGSAEERDFLETTYSMPRDHILSNQNNSFKEGILRMTGSRGVDIVLNSLSNDALQATWDCVAPFGRFVELGIQDVSSNASLEMRNFERNTRFEYFDLLYMMKHHPSRAHRVFQGMVQLVIDGGLPRVTPVTVHPFSQITPAFQSMQSGQMTKLVLEPHDENVVPMVPSREPTCEFDSAASYVISGGLGGLGRSIARWMVTRGARNLILLSRRGPIEDSARNFVNELKTTCDNVAAPACDVAERDALQRTIDECLTHMPSIKGCIQGSLVLKDNRFEDMMLDKWQSALRPKVDASWNLHHILGQDLDFFILLSSFMGIAGNQEQSNYAAGNTFQDSLARYRVSQGLPAVALDLPVVLGVGFVAEKPELMDTMRSAGFDTMSEEELHAVLDYHCLSPRKSVPLAQSQVVLRPGLPHELAAAGIPQPSWMADPLFNHLSQIETTSVVEQVVDKGNVKYATLLADASSLSDAEQVVLDALLLKLTRVLSVDISNLDPGKPLHAFGIDSLVAVEVRSWLSKELGSELSVLDMTNKSSISQLAVAAAAKSRFLPSFKEV